MIEEMNQKKCEVCQEEAKYLCLKCKLYFCEECSKLVHKKKINKDHKIEEIEPFVQIDTKCQVHKDIPLNKFCLDEMGK